MTFTKSVILYGLAMAVLIGVLKLAEYRFYVRDLSIEMYVGFVALLFILLGAWIGRKMTRADTISTEGKTRPDEAELKKLGITKREYEVLGLIASGMSNREIADKLFVSTSTIKTHTSSLFSKLDATRRTQAIHRAKELGILH